MSTMQAVVVVGLGALGITMIVAALPWFRRPALARRVAPYLGALGPRRSLLLSEAQTGGAGMGAVLRPVIVALGQHLHRLLGDDARDLGERLAAAGSRSSPGTFRAEQVTWGLLGLAGGVALSLVLVAVGRSVSVVVALATAVASAAAGVVARDRALSRAVRERQARARAELPTVVDMVCIAVTAGESLRGALDLVASRGSGPIAVELRAALRAARAGTPLAQELERCAGRLGLPELDAFVGAVVAAQERGVPLAEALRATAFDVRERQKRELIEAAGRKQVSMLVPVVALILPVALVFAFYPGVVAIKTLVR